MRFRPRLAGTNLLYAMFAIGGIVLLAGCTPDQFPSRFRYANPFNIPDLPESIHVTDADALTPRELVEVPATYRNFLKQGPSVLDAVAAQTTMPHFRDWLLTQRDKQFILEIYDFGDINAIKRLNHLIRIVERDSYAAWRTHWPEFGMSLELVATDETLPVALQEVYRLGALWLFSFPRSGYFFAPDEVKPVEEVDWLNEYAREFSDASPDAGLPIDDLKAFYTDSGCWLMHDSNEIVYVGGVECGDFYRSGLPLHTVIDNIFAELLTEGARLNIESFAPKADAAQ